MIEVNGSEIKQPKTKRNKTEEERIEELRIKKEEITIKIRQATIRKRKADARVQAAATKVSRAIDTRRKILAGAYILNQIENDECKKTEFMDGLNKFLTQDNDRKLFELPAIEQPSVITHMTEEELAAMP